MVPQGIQIGSGPIKGGFFNNDGTAFTGPNPLLKPGLGPRDPNFYKTTLYEGGRRPPSFFNTLGTVGGQQMIPEQGPLSSGIGQLPNGTGTQMPLGGFPIPNVSSVNSNNTQGIGSFFNNKNQQNNFSYINNNNNNNQDFGQYLNSYINNSINQSMQSIFKGIMSLFQ